jgi:hypothetical protein
MKHMNLNQLKASVVAIGVVGAIAGVGGPAAFAHTPARATASGT